MILIYKKKNYYYCRSNIHIEHCNMTYLLTIYIQTRKFSIRSRMEELRTKFFNSVNIVEEKNSTVLNQLTKLELQAKLLALNIIADESTLDMPKYSKDELVEFIISLNLC